MGLQPRGGFPQADVYADLLQDPRARPEARSRQQTGSRPQRPPPARRGSATRPQRSPRTPSDLAMVRFSRYFLFQLFRAEKGRGSEHKSRALGRGTAGDLLGSSQRERERRQKIQGETATQTLEWEAGARGKRPAQPVEQGVRGVSAVAAGAVGALPRGPAGVTGGPRPP